MRIHEAISTSGTIGPHQGKELELMSAGKKPVALVGDNDVERFRSKIDSGELVLVKTMRGAAGKPVYIISVPGQESRAQELASVYGEYTRRCLQSPNFYNSDASIPFHEKIGQLLGYSDQDIQYYVDKNIRELREEYDPEEHEERVHKRLRKLGYEVIGSGVDAQVFARASGDVIKIIMPLESGEINTPGMRVFYKFYDFCMEHSDLDCLPRFKELEGKGGAHHSRITIGGIKHLQIGMERLQELEQDSPRTAVVWALSDFATKNVTWESALRKMTDDPYMWDNLELLDGSVEIDDILEYISIWTRHERAEMGVFYNTMRLLYHTGRINKVGWDLHTENVMLRDNTLVITDPWFSSEIEEM